MSIRAAMVGLSCKVLSTLLSGMLHLTEHCLIELPKLWLYCVPLLPIRECPCPQSFQS